MPHTTVAQRKSIHQLAFEHYLRTGERLTNAEWLERHERKFNPYHDELGRFTSPPGVTVSWGSYGPPRGDPIREGRRRGSTRNTAPGRARSTVSEARPTSQPEPADRAAANTTGASGSGFRTDLVRNAVSSRTSNADTYFELNKRQATLDRLRREAGPNPKPDVRADFDEFQRRLDADRAVLDARSQIADREIGEIFRAGATPYDLLAGGLNIAAGEGELRDYLAVVGAAPIGGTIGKIGKVAAEALEPAARGVVQLGGAHRVVRKLRGYHSHHIPPKRISPLRWGEGPSIAMLPEDHRLTLSYGRRKTARALQQEQTRLIAQGEFKAAQQLDIDHIRNLFGDKYDEAIDAMLQYTRHMGF